MTQHSGYYLPQPSNWPLKGSIALFLTTFGGANWLHKSTFFGLEFGPYLFGIGIATVLYMMFGWFSVVIGENRAGLLSDKQVDHSFRWGMAWFIFSEVMFFGAFFAALFYARLISVPVLGGEQAHYYLTHLINWPNFTAQWPVLSNPNPNAFTAPNGVMETWGIPAINTLILLSSGATITVAHWALLKSKRHIMLMAQAVTILLGLTFLGMQAHEYTIAYMEKGLTLASGIYGTTFFMLTGFHALHVTVGTIGLCVILYRMFKHDFSPTNHFAFEAIAWYWHFVDVVWLCLFVLVYWL